MNLSPSNKVSGMRIGLDIGGTKTLAVLIDPAGQLITSVRMLSARGDRGVTQTALTVVDDLLRKARVTYAECAGIGVGIPGVVDFDAGTVKNAVNLDLSELPLRDILQEAIGVPAWIDNDVNLAALGAASALSLQGSIAYLNVGTGVAASLLLEGRILRGHSGVAGEIGHLPIDPNGDVCLCGQRGCIETLAAGAAISRKWPSTDQHASDALYRAHLAGDPGASKVFLDLASGIAQAVRALVLSFDPQIVVLGGGMRKLGSPLWEAVDSVFEGWARESAFVRSLDLPNRLQILPSAINAGALGAALIVPG